MKKYLYFLKTFGVFGIGLFVVVLLVLFNYFTRNYFEQNNKIIDTLNALEKKELKLNYIALSQNIYLYSNFDKIPKIERQIDTYLYELKNNKAFQEHKQSYKEFLLYSKLVHKKIDLIYSTETLIAPTKNAIMYLSFLFKKFPTLITNTKDKRYVQNVLNILSEIMLSKSSMDLSFSKNLSKQILVLKKIKFAKNQQKLKALHDILIENIKVVNRFFPKIILNLQKVLHSNSQTQLKKVENLFLHSTSEKLKIITYVSILLISFVVFSIFLVIMLIFRLEKDKKTLAKMVVTDALTSLYNRIKLNQDIQNKQKQILFIVNIDRFKYYNDFYGIEVGDFLLQKVAKYIKQIFPNELNPTFYRIGDDDFGILIEEKGDIDLEKIAQKLCYSFGEISFEYKDVEFNISVSVGISKEYPLIETADIMLKYLKKNHKTFGVYNNKLDHKQQIKENLQKTQTLLKAIKTNHLIPYYQPILSNKTGEIVKYEVLARITSKGTVQSIYPFLDIAKENKTYKFITQIIYEKAFQKFENTNICFSLNIALFDLQDNDNMQYLYRLFERYNEVLPRVTFEILESDAVNDYGLLKKFITFVKSKGAKIAIDDFGSGYSNFVHILNLDVDILKIDGSLIKELDTNKKMQIITNTIVQFAKANNLEVIAEFVHSKEVLQKVKELNIDCSQGFYLGEPKGDIVG